MKSNIKLAFCIWLILLITLPTNVIAQLQSFIIDGKYQLTMNTPNTFTISVQKDNDIYFDSVRTPKKIVGVLLNKVIISDNEEQQKQYIQEHKRKVQRAYNTYIKEGKEEVLDYIIPCISFSDPDLPVTNKLLYLTNGNKLLLMTIAYEDDAPIEDIELLIEKVVEAVKIDKTQ